MKRLSLFLLLLSLGVAAGRAAENITMTTNGQIGCPGAPPVPSTTTISLASWNWGSNDTFSPGAAGGYKLTLSQIALTKQFDACTTAMLGAYFKGAPIKSVEIDQSKTTNGSAPPVPVAKVVLTNAFLASYGVGGTADSPATEFWTLSFEKICVTTYGQTVTGQSDPGTTVCYGAAG
ncbi:MAG: type VI secretion system tube protein Hcp [Terracidiphilus sp.]